MLFNNAVRNTYNRYETTNHFYYFSLIAISTVNVVICQKIVGFLPKVSKYDKTVGGKISHGNQSVIIFIARFRINDFPRKSKDVFRFFISLQHLSRGGKKKQKFTLEFT